MDWKIQFLKVLLLVFVENDDEVRVKLIFVFKLFNLEIFFLRLLIFFFGDEKFLSGC